MEQELRGITFLVNNVDMRIYLYFLFSAFFLFKEKGFSNPKFYVSVLSTLIITLLSLNIFFISKMVFGLSNTFILIVFPLAILFEKLGNKYFEKKYEIGLKSYQYLESKKLLNTITLVAYYVVALISVMVTIGITKHFG